MTRRRWSAGRATAALLMATVWMATGVAVYLYLSAHRSTIADQVKKPGEGKPMSGPITRLPGTLYIAQGGTMYRLQRGTFTPVLNAPGGASRWTQPAFTPNGENLVVVRRDYASSDLFVMDTSGRILNQLTHNANRTVEFNHWAFYPRLSPDGSSLFFSYDRKDPGNIYNVVLSVYSMPLTGNFNQAKRWTVPASYTGGDIQPIPLQSGGLIYTKYSFDEKAKRILSQIYLMTRSGAPGKPLTLIEDDCSQPAFSPDGQRLAMICTGGKQFANLEIAPFDGSKLGQRQVLVSGQLTAQPTWSPDGTSLLYLAPKSIAGHFQLWLQPVPAPTTAQASSVATPTPTRSGVPPRGAQVGQPAATPTPLPAAPTPSSTPLPQPVQLTSDLDFDATSTIAWHG